MSVLLQIMPCHILVSRCVQLCMICKAGLIGVMQEEINLSSSVKEEIPRKHAVDNASTAPWGRKNLQYLEF